MKIDEVIDEILDSMTGNSVYDADKAKVVLSGLMLEMYERGGKEKHFTRSDTIRWIYSVANRP